MRRIEDDERGLRLLACRAGLLLEELRELPDMEKAREEARALRDTLLSMAADVHAAQWP